MTIWQFGLLLGLAFVIAYFLADMWLLIGEIARAIF